MPLCTPLRVSSCPYLQKLDVPATKTLSYFVLLSAMKKKRLNAMVNPLRESYCPYAQILDVLATNTLAYFVLPSTMKEKKVFCHRNKTQMATFNILLLK
jgi:hypothetical protein